MSDLKLTALTEVTELSDNDLLYVVINPDTSPESKKISKTNAELHTQSHALDSTSDHTIGGLTSLCLPKILIDKLVNSQVIDDGTSVKIGTTTGTAKLQVDGAIAMTSDSVLQALFTRSGTPRYGIMQLYEDGVLKVNLTAKGSSYLIGGFLGIGTDTQVSTDIINSNGTIGILAGNRLKLYNSTNSQSASIYNPSVAGTRNLTLRTDVDAITIDNLGNVGIGIAASTIGIVHTLATDSQICTNVGENTASTGTFVRDSTVGPMMTRADAGTLTDNGVLQIVGEAYSSADYNFSGHGWISSSRSSDGAISGQTEFIFGNGYIYLKNCTGDFSGNDNAGNLCLVVTALNIGVYSNKLEITNKMGYTVKIEYHIDYSKHIEVQS